MCARMIQLRVSPFPEAISEGANNNSTPPIKCKTPIVFSQLKKRSVIRPRKSGAMIAAMGTAPKASPMISLRLLDDKAKPSVVNHAPQTKNWRNIIMDSLIRMDEFMS